MGNSEERKSCVNLEAKGVSQTCYTPELILLVMDCTLVQFVARVNRPPHCVAKPILMHCKSLFACAPDFRSSENYCGSFYGKFYTEGALQKDITLQRYNLLTRGAVL
jgi:hypothetical protein